MGYSGKTDNESGSGGQRSASWSLVGIGGCALVTLPVSFREMDKGRERQPDVILSFQKQRASIIP